MNTASNISIFSKALYSSWCYHPAYQTLFDCGEGCATYLNNSLPGLEKIFFTHDHGDHTLGLPSVIGCRKAAQGMSRNVETMEKHNKPLAIYYPRGNRLFESLFDFCNKRFANWLRYDLNLVPIDVGFELQLGKNIFIRAIEMKHQKDQLTLGYVIYENRTRLKKEFVGQDIRALSKQPGFDRSSLSETYRANLFAYCLDSYEIVDPTQLTGCDAAIMDCTFLKAEDRTDMTHFTLDEATTFCKNIGVKKMYAAHVSSRYDYTSYVRADYGFVINPDHVNDL